jgi:UDPglucose 6-dehydrogenase
VPRRPTISVFGAGYVGLVVATCFAELGHDVVVCDVVVEKIEALKVGAVPIPEPGLNELLAKNRQRLTFTSSAAAATEGADFLYVAVGTPPTAPGNLDLAGIWAVVDGLSPVGGSPVLVMKSTVPVGTGAKVRASLDARGLAHVVYVSNPEFFSEGTAIRDFFSPQRVVVGAFGREEGDRVAALYAVLDAPVVRCDVASAEMIKLAANAFLTTRISFINEIANVCELVGADVKAVAEGIGLDQRLGRDYLSAGIGFGGPCFAKDLPALKHMADESGYDMQLLSVVMEINELQKRRIPAKLKKHLGALHGRAIALLGLAFKPGTDDMYAAPSLVIAAQLLAEGALVRAWDPLVGAAKAPEGVVVCDSMIEAVRGADAAVIVTEWPQLKTLACVEVRKSMARPLIIDGRNLLDPVNTRARGFEYESIGRLSMESHEATVQMLEDGASGGG